MLEVLATLCGVLVDPEKSENEAISMIVLGMSIEWCLTFQRIQVRLDRLKARQWQISFEEALLRNELQPDQAQKMAGRLQWCLTASTSRAGRSFLKALFAQANAPLKGAAAVPSRRC